MKLVVLINWMNFVLIILETGKCLANPLPEPLKQCLADEFYDENLDICRTCSYICPDSQLCAMYSECKGSGDLSKNPNEDTGQSMLNVNWGIILPIGLISSLALLIGGIYAYRKSHRKRLSSSLCVVSGNEQNSLLAPGNQPTISEVVAFPLSISQENRKHDLKRPYSDVPIENGLVTAIPYCLDTSNPPTSLNPTSVPTTEDGLAETVFDAGSPQPVGRINAPPVMVTDNNTDTVDTPDERLLRTHTQLIRQRENPGRVDSPSAGQTSGFFSENGNPLGPPVGDIGRDDKCPVEEQGVQEVV